MDDEGNFCPPSSTSCYYYNITAEDYASHKAACEQRGGYLVAYNTPEEQVGWGARSPRTQQLWFWLHVLALTLGVRAALCSWRWRRTSPPGAALLLRAITSSVWRRRAICGTGRTAPAQATANQATAMMAGRTPTGTTTSSVTWVRQAQCACMPTHLCWNADPKVARCFTQPLHAKSALKKRLLLSSSHLPDQDVH